MWADYASGEYVLPAGEGEFSHLYFNTAYDTVGTYRFTFEFRVPPNSWLPIPQIKSKASCSVKVEKPPEPPAMPVGRLSATGAKKPSISLRKVGHTNKKQEPKQKGCSEESTLFVCLKLLSPHNETTNVFFYR